MHLLRVSPALLFDRPSCSDPDDLAEKAATATGPFHGRGAEAPQLACSEFSLLRARPSSDRVRGLATPQQSGQLSLAACPPLPDSAELLSEPPLKKGSGATGKAFPSERLSSVSPSVLKLPTGLGTWCAWDRVLQDGTLGAGCAVWATCCLLDMALQDLRMDSWPSLPALRGP